MGDMDTDQKELDTLRRMLATPPTPHKAKKPAREKPDAQTKALGRSKRS